jgi:hypothetical protein
MHDAKVIVRYWKPEDNSFIMSTWLRGQYWGEDYWHDSNQAIFFKHYSERIAMLIPLYNTEIHCAVLEDDPSCILAYLVCSDDVIYWAYTKKDYRKTGLIKLLCKNKEFKYCNSITKMGRRILAKHPEITFNPWAI